MRTTKLFFTTLIITAIIFTFGCRKESVSITTDNIIQSSAKLNKPVQRAYRDSFDTWYQFIPDFANGWDAANPTPFLAWYPGGGDGNAHISVTAKPISISMFLLILLYFLRLLHL